MPTFPIRREQQGEEYNRAGSIKRGLHCVHFLVGFGFGLLHRMERRDDPSSDHQSSPLIAYHLFFVFAALACLKFVEVTASLRSTVWKHSVESILRPFFFLFKNFILLFCDKKFEEKVFKKKIVEREDKKNLSKNLER